MESDSFIYIYIYIYFKKLCCVRVGCSLDEIIKILAGFYTNAESAQAGSITPQQCQRAAAHR
jgi:hypothetical protein